MADLTTSAEVQRRRVRPGARYVEVTPASPVLSRPGCTAQIIDAEIDSAASPSI